MTCLDSLLSTEWKRTVETLGGAAALTVSARDTKAFQRGRVVRDPLVLLRLVLAYCLGDHGLRLTAAWASAMGLAHLSNVGLLYRLQQCDAWLQHLVGQMLARRLPRLSQGRPVSWLTQRRCRRRRGPSAAATGSGASTRRSICRPNASAISS